MGTKIHCDTIVSIDTRNGKQSFLIVNIWDYRNMDGKVNCECIEAHVTRTTQFFVFWSPSIVIKPLRLGLCHQRGVDGLVAVYQDVSLGEDLLRLLDVPVALVLCGALQAYFQSSTPLTTTNASAPAGTVGIGACASNRSRNSLLMTAPAGTGSVELVVAAAHRMVVILSPPSL